MNIVITGASRGIGLAEAKLFDTPGNRLVLVAKSVESFKGTFNHATLIAADLSTSEGIKGAAEQIATACDTVDVLINNVGVMIMKKFEDLSSDDVDTMLNTNLRSHMLLSQALLPLLLKSNGAQIVFMSSMAAKSFIVGESVYSATKSGVSAFANVLRNELGGKVRISTVHAWGVNTWGAAEPNDLMKPQDIAEAVQFIVSRPKTAVVESIELGSPVQWRGGQAPWSPR
jgi:3-hydroxy acid dehydrogenase/malonic semialdehyde reductase